MSPRHRRKLIPEPRPREKKSRFLLVKPLEGPAGAFLPQVRVELLEDSQAMVDGCRGIVEYSEERVRLSAGRFILKFTGEGLRLRSLTDTGVIVEGSILSLEYC